MRQEFPADATDAEISAALEAIPAPNAPNAPKARTWSDMAAVGTQTAAKAIPAMATGAAEVATNPAIPRVASQVGRVVGGLAPVVAGAQSYGPAGGAVGLAGAAGGAWAGGRTGWFTGKLLQSVAAPVAKALETIAPFAQGLSTISGAQAVSALAQIADPKRTDVGVAGIGATNTSVSDRATIMQSQMEGLMAHGMPRSDAARTVYNAWAKYLYENK